MEKTSVGGGAKFTSQDVWKGEKPLGGNALGITVGQNADGRLEIFYIGTDGALYHNWQTTAGSSTWHGETKFAGDSAKQIAVARNADGTLEIFYVGSNNDLYHNRQTAMNSSASWGGETEFPIPPGVTTQVQQVTVGQYQDGRLAVAYIGSDTAVYQTIQAAPSSAAWGGAQQVFDSFFTYVLLLGTSGGRLSRILLDLNSRFTVASQLSANSAQWTGVDYVNVNDFAKQVTAGVNADGTLEIFYVGTNNNLYHNRQLAPYSSSWDGETHFPSASAQQVVVAQNQSGTLEIFYVGMNNYLYHNWQTAPNSTAWVGEMRISNDSARQIAAARNVDGRLEIFYVGTDLKIYHNAQTTPA